MSKKKLFPEIVVLLLAVLCVVTVFLVHKNLSYYRYASSATPFFMLKPDDVEDFLSLRHFQNLQRLFGRSVQDPPSFAFFIST